jgi:uncharacterized protein (TIGR02271 family)
VKDFFKGESDDRVDYRDSISDQNWDQNRAEYYRRGIAGGGALVSVSGSRAVQGGEILERAGGELRETGFESTEGMSARDAGSGERMRDTGSRELEGEHRIQLRGEMLRAYKERVQRGEVRLRKDVVTENQTVEVPVTREELVIERVAGSGSPAAGEIGSDQEIRVPLSEERARVEKQPVVTEEVRVGKRAVQNTEQVADSVRHEELRVEKEGDIDIDPQTKRKKPAA